MFKSWGISCRGGPGQRCLPAYRAREPGMPLPAQQKRKARKPNENREHEAWAYSLPLSHFCARWNSLSCTMTTLHQNLKLNVSTPTFPLALREIAHTPPKRFAKSCGGMKLCRTSSIVSWYSDHRKWTNTESLKLGSVSKFVGHWVLQD